MENLATPFGEIKILIDGKSVPYVAQEGRKLDVLCPRVLGRYQITVFFIPDGAEHTIACVFESDRMYERTPEGGERSSIRSAYGR